MLHYNLVALVEIILANISLKEALFEENISEGVVLRRFTFYALKIYHQRLACKYSSPPQLCYPQLRYIHSGVMRVGSATFGNPIFKKGLQN